jgi:hypothetical protein
MKRGTCWTSTDGSHRPGPAEAACSVICLHVFDKRKETLSDRMKPVFGDLSATGGICS